MYFCTKSLDLKFVTQDGTDYIVQISNYEPKSFTDDDFKNAKCASS